MAELLKFRKQVPALSDVGGRWGGYFWARGGRFNRAVMVEVNSGARSEVGPDGRRRFFPELNFTFHGDYPDHIWASDLAKWPGLDSLEWAGPVPEPE